MFSATESKSGTRTPHEYIRDTLSFRFRDCKFCGARTELTCIKCGFCYSCHWKKEQAEKRLLDNKLSEIFPPSLLSTEISGLIDREAEQSSPSPSPQHQQKLIVDVHGRIAEPVCTYYRCNHKFSVHGSRGCGCKHPTNKTLGIFGGSN
jgi:hypothetical protein